MGLFSRPKSFIGLDIGSHSVKVVQLTRTGGQAYLTGFARARVSGEDPRDSIRQALLDALVATHRCATAVSGRSVIVRYISMMPMPDAQLRQQMAYEADKYIPYAINEVQLYSCRLGEGAVEGGQMKVLLVAAKRTLIEEHYALLKRSGLEPAIIDVDAFALGNAFDRRTQHLAQTAQAEGADRVNALIDIGATKTNINILRGTESQFTREVYIAGNDFTEAIAKRLGVPPEEAERMKCAPAGAADAAGTEPIREALQHVLEDIGSEVRLSFDYFENQFDRGVETVWLSGGSARYPGLERMLQEVLGVETRLWDPTEGLEIGNPRLDLAALEGMNSDMAIAVGLAGRVGA